MNTDDQAARQKQIEQLKSQIAQLERELHQETPTHWQAGEYYGAYHAASGFLLGAFGAIASLLFNVVGSLVVGKHPLRLIQVYLTFPLGARALSDDMNTGVILAIGCCLYLATGMVLGVPFQMLMARFLPRGNLWQRLAWGTVIGLLLWSINFYLILSWLQPALFGGGWITDPTMLPPWVGAATHLVFAWTMAAFYPWGTYVPYHRQTELLETNPGV